MMPSLQPPRNVPATAAITALRCVLAYLCVSSQQYASALSRDTSSCGNAPHSPRAAQLGRRQLANAAAIASAGFIVGLLPPKPSIASEASVLADATAPSLLVRHAEEWQITLPLEACPGGASCLRLTLYGRPTPYSPSPQLPFVPINSMKHTNNNARRSIVPFRVYRVIVDTGSPYLVVSENDGDGSVIASGSLPIDNQQDANTISGGNGLLNLLDTIQQTIALLLPEDNTYDPFEFGATHYEPTEEIYGSQTGVIHWRSAPAKFRDGRLSSSVGTSVHPFADTAGGSSSLILGAMDDALTNESGGSLIGLVKRSNDRSTKIQRRPTWLEQARIVGDPVTHDATKKDNVIRDATANIEELEVSSFRLDYPSKELTLSSTSLISSGSSSKPFDLIDLRPLGDFVEHYACVVESVVFDDTNRISSESESESLYQKDRSVRKPKRDIVAVFDSGLTGCLLIKPFWDQLVEDGMDPSSFASVRVNIATSRRTQNNQKPKRHKDKLDTEITSIASSQKNNRLFYVNPISLDWFEDEATAPYVIVLGQTFLSQGALTIDIDGRKGTFETSSSRATY